jgi:hypothetical protein
MSGRFDRLPIVGHRSDASAGSRVGRCGACGHDGLVHVEEINIGLSEALKPVASAAAVAGKGLRGDRHFDADGAKPGQALTLIEAEALEDVGLTGAQSRRQVVVRGVRLDESPQPDQALTRARSRRHDRVFRQCWAAQPKQARQRVTWPPMSPIAQFSRSPRRSEQNLT